MVRLYIFIMYFDIGANIGRWSQENMRLCNRIIAVEASPTTYDKLVNNIGNNPNIVCLNYAVCNSDKEYIETTDLGCIFKEQFLTDNTIRQIKTYNGKITQINYEDKHVIANKDLTLMKEIIGDDFDNENLTNYGVKLFNEFIDEI